MRAVRVSICWSSLVVACEAGANGKAADPSADLVLNLRFKSLGFRGFGFRVQVAVSFRV